MMDFIEYGGMDSRNGCMDPRRRSTTCARRWTAAATRLLRAPFLRRRRGRSAQRSRGCCGRPSVGGLQWSGRCRGALACCCRGGARRADGRADRRECTRSIRRADRAFGPALGVVVAGTRTWPPSMVAMLDHRGGRQAMASGDRPVR